MTREEATIIAGRVLARYPAVPVGDGVLAAWTQELAERFGHAQAREVWAMAADFFRRNPSARPPGLDQLCGWMADARARQAPALRLVEPEVPEEERARNLARLRLLMAGIGR
jgi:hypothetical protein